jgi:hypothetical protein
MDIETIQFEDKGLTAHILQDADGSFWACVTKHESEDAIYESRGWDTVAAASEDAAIMVKFGPLFI